jgi:hypothetical protein
MVITKTRRIVTTRFIACPFTYDYTIFSIRARSSGKYE